MTSPPVSAAMRDESASGRLRGRRVRRCPLGCMTSATVSAIVRDDADECVSVRRSPRRVRQWLAACVGERVLDTGELHDTM